jgi:copper oxidase (laccase) domain-containing protein
LQRHEFEELKLEWDELRDTVKQLMESLNFQPKPYTRDQVHEDDVVDDNDGMVDDNENVANDNDDMSDDNNVVFDEDLEQEWQL